MQNDFKIFLVQIETNILNLSAPKIARAVKIRLDPENLYSPS